MHSGSKKARERLSVTLGEKGVELIEYRPGHAGAGGMVTIRCATCGALDSLSARTITPEWLGCRQCRKSQGLIRGPRRPYTTAAVSDFIAQEGGQYLGGEVVAHDSLVLYRCRHCGQKGEKTAKNMYRRGPSGKCCSGLRCSVTRAMAGNWLEKAQKIARQRGGKCLATRPITTTEPIRWRCAQGHTWRQCYDVVVNRGNWCQRCARSKAERYVIALLEEAFEEEFPCLRPDWLGGLELDGYCEGLGLAVEVNGEQHYTRIHHYHDSKKGFLGQQDRDIKKRQLCEQYGVALLVVPFWVSHEDLEWAGVRKYIATQLDRMGFRPKNAIGDISVAANQIYNPQDEKYRAFAECVRLRGGRYLASDYGGYDRKIPITCAEGHRFTPYPSNVVHKGTWCGKCAGTGPLSTLEVQRALAELRWSLDEGERYVSAQSVLRIRCPQGHLLKRTWNSWQQSHKKKSYVSCKQCDVGTKASRFMDVMQERGLKVIDKLETYTKELAVRAQCRHCGLISTRQIRSWVRARHTPCCRTIV